MTPEQFVEKWPGATLSERAASHEHFLDLCHLLDQPTPAQSDPTGHDYAFEKPVHGDRPFFRLTWCDPNYPSVAGGAIL